MYVISCFKARLLCMRLGRQGGIKKAGDSAARRMLIEVAWSYRFPARISREQLLRQEGLTKPIRDTAWKDRNDCVGVSQVGAGRQVTGLVTTGHPGATLVARIL